MAITIATAIGAMIYYGFLVDFVQRYRNVSIDLAAAEADYRTLDLLLATGPRIDARYDAIAASLPKPEPGKRPEMVFTEQIAALCAELGIHPPPTIQPHKAAEVPDARGFAYLVLPVEKIEGDLDKITAVLRGFYERNYIIRELAIGASTRTRDTRLSMSVHLAQIVRSEDLEPGAHATAQRP